MLLKVKKRISRLKKLKILFDCLGTCVGLVVKTGDRTVMGRIANLASSKWIYKTTKATFFLRFGNG